jgi:aspartyl protease family protein
VDAQVNGQATHFLIDTGASGIVLTAFDAANMGINTNDLSFIVPVSTANGNAMAAPVTLVQIVIGGIVRKNLRALVAQQGRLDQSLLGMDYLNTLSSFTVKQDDMILQD